jgi:hypothetical protein
MTFADGFRLFFWIITLKEPLAGPSIVPVDERGLPPLASGHSWDVLIAEQVLSRTPHTKLLEVLVGTIIK